METVYIETLIVSHATARPSSDINIATLQMQARDWWRIERPKFDLVTSQLVINEAAAGDPSAAADRLKLLAGVPLIPITDEVRQIANALVSASSDASKGCGRRVACCHCRLCWCRISIDAKLSAHCELAHTLPRVYAILAGRGYSGLLICTPAEFLGELYDDKESNS